MAAAELVGDLAVLYDERAARLPVRTPGSTHERFQTWFGFGEHVFRLAIEAGIAVAREPESPRAALATLAGVVERDEAALIHELVDSLHDGFSYIGHEQGYFYSATAWEELCWFRSGLVFLAGLAGVEIDLEDVEWNMERYGIEMFEQLEVPAGMPVTHWWWFGERPPSPSSVG